MAALMAAPDTTICKNPIDVVVANAVAHGGAFLGIVDVPGDGYDQIVVFLKRGMITIGAAQGGCIITPPIPVGLAKRGLGV
jgi:hypothetical protein